MNRSSFFPYLISTSTEKHLLGLTSSGAVCLAGAGRPGLAGGPGVTVLQQRSASETKINSNKT